MTTKKRTAVPDEAEIVTIEDIVVALHDLAVSERNAEAGAAAKASGAQAEVEFDASMVSEAEIAAHRMAEQRQAAVVEMQPQDGEYVYLFQHLATKRFTQFNVALVNNTNFRKVRVLKSQLTKIPLR